MREDYYTNYPEDAEKWQYYYGSHDRPEREYDDYCASPEPEKMVAFTILFRKARKDGPTWKKGDIVCTKTGYVFEPNGPRVKYLKPRKYRASNQSAPSGTVVRYTEVWDE